MTKYILKRLMILLPALLIHTAAGAQFYVDENDKASTKWEYVSSKNFRIIYPVGSDSLATDYLRALELYRPEVAKSVGMVSGQFMSKPLDVILHTSNSVSNGIVAWTPSRVDLYTIPMWTEPNALPWLTNLAIHEGRHMAQMQAGYRRIFRPFRFILGQLASGAFNAYPGSLLSEGDAVVAETALSKAGRGRKASFLDQYMYDMDNGSLRSYPKARYGSIYRPAPDNYALGYMMVSAARVKYDAPYFMAEYLDYVARRPYDPWPLRHNLRRISGTKFRRTYNDLMYYHYDIWKEEAKLRTPFVPYEELTTCKSAMSWYTNIMEIEDGDLLCVKKDIYNVPKMIRIGEDGKEKNLFSLPSYIGRVSRHEDKLYWNQVRRNPRWGLVYDSEIVEYDLNRGKKRRIRSDAGNYNPICLNDSTLAAVQYSANALSSIVLLDANSGKLVKRYSLPEVLQAGTMTTDGNVIYFTASCEEGMGIWRIKEGQMEELLEPVSVNIANLECHDGLVYFRCDHNGVDEFYSLDPQSSEVLQLTSSMYGGREFARKNDGSVVFARLNGRGTNLVKNNPEDILSRKVDWNRPHPNAVADALSAQEDTLVFSQRLKHLRKVDMEADMDFSAPARYVKAAHAFRIHSWAPLYVNIDAVESLSFDNVFNVAAPGASLWFQNSMGTLYGQLGYKISRFKSTEWFHSTHINLTYKGLYPVFEFQLHVNERKSKTFDMVEAHMSGTSIPVGYKVEDSRFPYIYSVFRTYIPLQWSDGLWYKGLIPQASIMLSNDMTDGKICFLLNAGVRAYVQQATPAAAVYPRWGIGAELRWLDPYGYFYLYSYLPGLGWGQGLKLSIMGQMDTGLRTSDTYISGRTLIIPRGYQESPLSSVYTEGLKFSADYAIPFNMGDWNIGSAFLCTRGIITPHFDASLLRPQGERNLLKYTYHPEGQLYSAGLSFEMDFNAFFWVKTPVRFGLTYSYNFGSLFPYSGLDKHSYMGVLFNIQIPN